MLGFDALSAAALSTVEPSITPPLFEATDIILWPVEATTDIYLRDPLYIETPVAPPAISSGIKLEGRKPAKKQKQKKILNDVSVYVKIWLDEEAGIQSVPLAPEPILRPQEAIDDKIVAPQVPEPLRIKKNALIAIGTNGRLLKKHGIVSERNRLLAIKRRRIEEERVLFVLSTLL